MSDFITIKIGGDVHSISRSDLEIQDAETERHQVAADVAWWGSVAASAQARMESLEAVATQWRAAALQKCLQVDEKMAEWKAKSAADSHQEYLKIQNDIVHAREQLNKAQAVHWALIRKSDMLREMIQSENGTRRSSHDIGRVPIPGGPKPLPNEPNPSDNRFAAFKGKRKAKEED